MTLNNIYAGKRVLVTGATGLIGSNLVKRLIAFPGIEVVACGRSKGKLESVFSMEIERGLKTLEHDISCPIPGCCGDFDFIFHAASPISGATIKSEPVSVIASNIKGTENCLAYLRGRQKMYGGSGTLVIFSSATVYGPPSAEDRICQEDDSTSCDGLSAITAPYSESKRMVEVLSTAYHRQFGIGVRIARLAYVYGMCPVPPRTAFYEFINQAAIGENMVFSGSGFGRRDNIYVDDAIDGLLAICEYGQNAVPYNISSNGELGNYAAIDEIAYSISRAAARMGIVSNVVVKNDKPRTSGVRLDNARIKAIGWTVKTSLDDGVFEILSHMGGIRVS